MDTLELAFAVELAVIHQDPGFVRFGFYLFPGGFVLPLSPMVKEAPRSNKMLNGSTYIKNFIAFFAMLSIIVAFREKKWRDFSLIGAYELAYIGIVMSSFTANSERYHDPAIP